MIYESITTISKVTFITNGIKVTNQPYMQAAIKFIKKYPASIICYLLYTWLCYITLKLKLDFADSLLKHPNERNMAMGEAVGYGYVILLFVAFIFFMVSAGNIIARKQNAFYVVHRDCGAGYCNNYD